MKLGHISLRWCFSNAVCNIKHFSPGANENWTSDSQVSGLAIIVGVSIIYVCSRCVGMTVVNICSTFKSTTIKRGVRSRCCISNPARILLCPVISLCPFNLCQSKLGLSRKFKRCWSRMPSHARLNSFPIHPCSNHTLSSEKKNFET